MQIWYDAQSDATVQRLHRAPLFCKTTGQLLANLIEHRLCYDRKTMTANDGDCSIGIYYS